MALPESRDQTFVDGTSKVPAATLNEGLQDFVVEMNAAARGRGFLLMDEFTGSAVGTDKWVIAVSGGGAVATVDDAAAGGRGAVSIAGGAAPDTASISTRNLNLGAVDLRLHARIRKVVITSGTLVVGLNSGTAAEVCHFKSINGANWFAHVGAAAGVDCGVAPSTTYQRLEFRRLAGVVKFYIDGVEKHSVAFATSIAAANLQVDMPGNAGVRVDDIKFWANT